VTVVDNGASEDEVFAAFGLAAFGTEPPLIIRAALNLAPSSPTRGQGRRPPAGALAGYQPNWLRNCWKAVHAAAIATTIFMAAHSRRNHSGIYPIPIGSHRPEYGVTPPTPSERL